MKPATRIAWALITAAAACALTGIWLASDQWLLTGAVALAFGLLVALYATIKS